MMSKTIFLLTSCLALLAMIGQLPTAISVTLPSHPRRSTFNATEELHKMFAVSDIPEDVKLNMTNLIAHDGISAHVYCDPPYRYADAALSSRARDRYEKSLGGAIWIYVPPGPGKCRQIACEGDEHNGVEVLACNDEPNHGFSTYGYLYGVHIYKIMNICANGDKVRGQSFTSGRDARGMPVNFNVIIKDVSPGTTCDRDMYNPCWGSVGSYIPNYCPHS